ncbi:MAG: hypothetical protein H8E66_10080 [Planctomycetes bacterium]|nr:hypothetical protein [Planctomycetota bacterium]
MAPVLVLRSRAERQSYEISQSGSTHILRVTFDEESYPSKIYPKIDWAFQLSDGTEENWRCHGLVVKWEFDSEANEFLKVCDGIQGTGPYELIPGASYRIVKHWWVEKHSQNSVTQKLHLYLISNDANRVLAEHQLTIVVNVVVPEPMQQGNSDEVPIPKPRPSTVMSSLDPNGARDQRGQTSLMSPTDQSTVMGEFAK